jgi:hypothetical protein
VAEQAVLLRALPTEAVDALPAVARAESDGALVVVELRQLGGAAEQGGSSMRGPGAAFTLSTIGIAAGPVAERTSAARAAVVAAMAPWDSGARLPSFARPRTPRRCC